MRTACYCALVHHPVRDREGGTFTSAVTPLDVHDIARSATTFGLAGYFLVTPIPAQQRFVERILGHWAPGGTGQQRMPERSTALGLCQVVPSIEAVLSEITAREGVAPQQIATAARVVGRPTMALGELRREIAEDRGRPRLLLLGTAHGLADSLLEQVDGVLEPIRGVAGYNHLSVRAAAAILFDRIFGELSPVYIDDGPAP